MLLAVYGTLRKGFPLHNILVNFNAKFINIGLTDALFNCYYGPYPICQKGGSTRVFVEIYEIGEDGLAVIDKVEAGYIRDIVKVYSDSGVLEAYMYVYDMDSEIPKGFILFEGSLFDFAEISSKS